MNQALYSRVGLIAGRPYHWQPSPGGYEHALATMRLLRWCVQIPEARLGVSVRGLGLIVRSIYKGLDEELSAGENRLLDRAGANEDDMEPWSNDIGVFDSHLGRLWEYIERAESGNEYVWLESGDVDWWIRATSQSLLSYHAINWAGDTAALSRLLDRHSCMVFGAFDVQTFSERVMVPVPDGLTPLARDDGYRPWLDEIAAASKQVGTALAGHAYWSWRLLDFDLDNDDNILAMPLLALWSAWPVTSRWAPPPVPTSPPSDQFTADQAAMYLEAILWKGVESIFARAAFDCGVSIGELITATNRRNNPAVFYLAVPSHIPQEAAQYVSPGGPDIVPLVQTCLASPDPASRTVSWGILGGDLIALRREWTGEYYRPLYLLLPVSSPLTEPTGLDPHVEADVANFTYRLTRLELVISLEAAAVERSQDRVSQRMATWPFAFENGNDVIEQAIALLPLVGQSDRADLSRSLAYLHVPLRRLQVRVEQVRGDLAEIQSRYYFAVDWARDSIRRMTLSSVSRVQAQDLRAALNDPYPFNFLEEPLKNLGLHMETLVHLGEQVGMSMDGALAQSVQRTREHLERWARRLGFLISLLALVIGLPTFVPQATLGPGNYPQWIEARLPLATLSGALRNSVVLLGLLAVFIFAYFLASSMRLYFPERRNALRRFMLLIQQAQEIAHNAPDMEQLERLDSAATDALATIFTGIEQLVSHKRSTTVRWPWRTAQAQDLAQDVRAFGDIVNLFILFPVAFYLPRSLCILLLKGTALFAADQPVTEEVFAESLTRIGFTPDECKRLLAWLTVQANVDRGKDLPVAKLSRILKQRGVTARPTGRRADRWEGPLDEEQRYADHGAKLVLSNQYAEAIEEYTAAIKLNPKVAEYHNGLGTAYHGVHRYDDATRAYRRAIALSPQTPRYHNNLAGVYLDQHKFAEATREYLARIRLSPDDALAAMVCLGVIRLHTGETEQGLRDMRRAKEIYRVLAGSQGVMTTADYQSLNSVALAGLGDPQALPLLQEMLRNGLLTRDSIADIAKQVELIKTAPQHPAGIDAILALLREALAKAG